MYTPNKFQWWNTCQYIMLHHTWSNNTMWAVHRFQNKDSQVSAHYVVWREWEIYKFGENEDIMRHAGRGEWEGITYMNLHAIGIEVVSDGYTYTREQRNATRKLINELMSNHWIPYTRIIRHKDYAPQRKRDISDQFWNNEFWSYAEYILSFDSNNMDKRQLMKISKDMRSALYKINSMIQDEIESEDLKWLLEEEKTLLSSTNDLIREKEDKYL